MRNHPLHLLLALAFLSGTTATAQYTHHGASRALVLCQPPTRTLHPICWAIPKLQVNNAATTTTDVRVSATLTCADCADPVSIRTIDDAPVFPLIGAFRKPLHT
ncbi:MAG: hypothetical protein IPH05_18925 [Flavobacteriales bacterium]|nr:hypothetical protein [Flavobacteriales bacterium]